MTIDLAKLKKLEAQASPAPWWSDNVDAEDGHGRYDAYCVGYGTKGLFDTTNADDQLIEEDFDEDHVARWDETGRRNAEFVFEMRNATPALIARIEKLEAALKPFAAAADAIDIDGPTDDDWPSHGRGMVKAKHLRAAREALK